MDTSHETNLTVLKKRATRALKTVIDPELFVNIIDLGLVYDMLFFTEFIQIKMTLSTPHCPLGEAIISRVDQAMSAEFPDSEIIVTLVWQPAWSPHLITDEGRAELYLPL